MRTRKTLTIVITMLMLCLALAGCGKKEDPEKSMKVYTMAILHQDADSLKKVGMTKEKVQESLRKSFSDAFLKSSGGFYTREQANRIANVYIKKLQTLDIGANGGEVKGDEASVQVVVGQIDMSSMNNPQTVLRLQQEIARNRATLKTQKQITDFATEFLIKEVENMPTGGAKEVPVECTYDKKKEMWVPKDPVKFGLDLDAATVKN